MSRSPLSLQTTFAFLVLFVGIAAIAQQQKMRPTPPVTLTSALRELSDLSELPAYRRHVIGAQVSSYDTTGGNDDGFSGKYSFIKRNADSTLVIADLTGPGMIHRIWTPTPSDDSLAFFIDDLKKPAFVIRYRDLFTGLVFPFVAPLCGNQLGGFYCYLPIPFRQHCRIVYRGKKTQFHQIQYSQYPASTIVQKFNINLNQEETAALNKVRSLWTKTTPSLKDYYPDRDLASLEQTIVLQPGETQTIFNAGQRGRILGIEFKPAAAFEGLSKSIDLRITWDNEKTPAVFCPVADFFGYAFGKASMKSLLMGVSENMAFCYFPMPFDQSAHIELISRKPDDAAGPITVHYRIIYSNEGRNPEREGKFYAVWNKSFHPAPHHPHTFLKATGRGHYVGTVLQAQGLKAGMTYFFEGDDSTVVDGQLRMHGTGSEDYFNGGWYALPDRWDAAMSLPLSGALDYSLPFCRTGGYRLFIGDKIPFESSFDHSIEHGPTNTFSAVDYTSVALYYGNQPSAPTMVPAADNTTVLVPDTLILFPQLLNLGFDGEIDIKPAWAYPTGGQTFFCTVTNDAALRIPLTGIPVGDYRLYLDDVTGPQGCQLSLWQRQTQLSDWKQRLQPTKTMEDLYLADVHLDALVNSITFRFRADKDRNQFAFNRLVLIRKK